MEHGLGLGVARLPMAHSIGFLQISGHGRHEVGSGLGVAPAREGEREVLAEARLEATKSAEVGHAAFGLLMVGLGSPPPRPASASEGVLLSHDSALRALLCE